MAQRINTPRISKSHKVSFLKTKVSKKLIIVNLFLAILYFLLLAFWFKPGDMLLYIPLMIGEVFHIWQVVGYGFTIWNTNHKPHFNSKFSEPVDVFITVVAEPIDIVEETVIAAKKMDYPNFKVFILNDGLGAKKESWKDMEILAEKHGITCITRQKNTGFKAGNINNALKETTSPYFVIFDADHVPHKDFLKETMGYFDDEKVAFVQSPQYYKNHKLNFITEGAWEQQSLFFGPIQKGKNRNNTAFMCGTNMVLKREAIEQVGGMCETNIAEDFLTSLFVHQKGWKSVYVPKVIAEGLAPEDFLSYYKQQFRWTRGSLEVIFKHNPLFMKGLTFAQKIQYLTSASYYFSGIIVIIDALLPIVFFYTGLVPLETSTMTLAAVFIPYIFINLYCLQASGNFNYTFRALSFSLSSFYIQIRALWAVIFHEKTKFSVTSKQQLQGNFMYLVIPHLIYISVAVIGFAIAVHRQGINASVMANSSWALLNVMVFLPFIYAASPKVSLKKMLLAFGKKINIFNLNPSEK